MRTTITIDDPLFEKIRALSHKEHKPLTRVIGELLARGMRGGKSPKAPGGKIRWRSRNMGAHIDYRDKELLYRTMEK
jgi:hypothetical protein